MKFATGAKTMRNSWVRSDGGSQNRAGTEFIDEIADSDSLGRLIPFEFNSEQTYILEFTDLALRVWKEGVLMATLITVYTEDELSLIRFAQSADVVTMTCEGHYVFELTRTSDTSWAIAQAKLGAVYDTGGLNTLLTAGAVGTKTNRYVLTGIYPNGEETAPLLQSTYYYITNIANASFPGISGTTVITTSFFSPFSTGIQVGDLIFLNLIPGMTELNGKYYTVTAISADFTQITINIDCRNFTAYDTGGFSFFNLFGGGAVYQACMSDLTAVNPPTTANPDILAGTNGCTLGPGPLFDPSHPNLVQVHPSGTLVAMNIYMQSNGLYGFIGTTAQTTFNNTGITPDITINPPEVGAFFDTSRETPSVCALLQQRRVFGNFPTNTENVVASATGLYHKYSKLNPLVDSDLVSFTMAGKKVSQVKHIVDAGQMIVFTNTGEFVALGNSAGFITPGEVNLKQQSAYGCSDLAPIILDGSAIFVQARGSFVREIQFDQQSGGFRGSDLTIYAKHLVEDNTIVDWAYQHSPHSLVWAVRDDGVLLSMTYVKEQQILAWARHDLEGGFVENVCVVPEGNEDKLYLIVKRTINGVVKRYLERMHTRYVDPDAIGDSVFMDCSLSYDGWNTDDTTMTLSGGTTWKYDEDITCTASASFFETDDVGNEIHLVGPDDEEILRCRIKAYISPTQVTVRPHKTVTTAQRNVGFIEWARAVDEVSGLEHLSNEDCAIFADGFVVASPNNIKFPIRTVSATGTLTLDKCYAVIHVGLPITADIELLDVDKGDPNTIDKNKNVQAVTVYLEKSRGGYFGPRNPDENLRNTEEDPLYGMIEIKPRNNEDYDDPAGLKSGPFEIAILPEWNSNGRVFIRQVDPLPMSILAVAPNGLLPLGGG